MNHKRLRAIPLLLIWLFAAGALVAGLTSAMSNTTAHPDYHQAVDLPHDHGAHHKPIDPCEACVNCLQHCANLAVASFICLALLEPARGIRLTPMPLLSRTAFDLPPPLRPPRFTL